MIDIGSNGISAKAKNHRRAFTWDEVEELRGNPLPVGDSDVPWEDVQAKLDGAGIDLDSQEVQDKIAKIKKAKEPEPVPEDVKERREKEKKLRSELSNASPTSNPELAKELDKMKKYLGLLDI